MVRTCRDSLIGAGGWCILSPPVVPHIARSAAALSNGGASSFRRKSALAAVGAALLTLWTLGGCERHEPGAGSSIVEEPTASALRDVSDAVLEKLRAAIQAAETGAPKEETAAKLRGSEAELLKLTEYYVPLLDAHERAYRAYRLYYAEPSRVESELERIETILHGVVRDRGSEVEGPVDEALALVEDVRSSMEARSPEAGRHLDELARKLSFMLLKGELILRE